MKTNDLLLITILFFVAINTSYYWEGKTGFMAMPVILLLLVVYIGLLIALIHHTCIAIKERFNSTKRTYAILSLFIVLLLAYFKPSGFINFDSFEGNDVLVARAEGAANCATTLKLKDNYTFKEKSVCFSISESRGSYKIINDTIYFTPTSRKEDFPYLFALIENGTEQKDTLQYIRLFEDPLDKGESLFITKNELFNSLKKQPKGQNIK